MNTFIPEEGSISAGFDALLLTLPASRSSFVLLEALSELARKLVPSEYIGVATVDRGKQTISCRDFTRAPATDHRALRTWSFGQGILAGMLAGERPFRLSGAVDAVGDDIFVHDAPLRSLLWVPISSSPFFQRWLVLANPLDATTFSENHEQTAVVFSKHATIASNTVEEHWRIDGDACGSEEIAASIFESIPEALAVLREDGRLYSVNERFLDLFGYTSAELLDQHIDMLVPEGLHELFRFWLQSNLFYPLVFPQANEPQLFGRRKDGSEFPADLSLSELRTGGRRLILSVVRDRTRDERRFSSLQEMNNTLTQQVGELQTSNEELLTFSYSVSHDLRAPLRQVEGFVRILHTRLDPNIHAEAIRCVQRIDDGVGHMRSLLESLFNLATLGRKSLSIKPTNLNELVSQVIETIVSEVPERAIEWNVESLPVISCDGVLVKAVFFNLLSNAVKFTCLRQVAVIHVSSSCQNGETILSVADNGVGFSQQQAGKLFTVFKRLHPCGDFPGTGVGLATVKRIIKKHGGRTWAQGEKNGGAKFHFTLLPVPADLPEIQT